MSANRMNENAEVVAILCDGTDEAEAMIRETWPKSGDPVARHVYFGQAELTYASHVIPAAWLPAIAALHNRPSEDAMALADEIRSGEHIRRLNQDETRRLLDDWADSVEALWPTAPEGAAIGGGSPGLAAFRFQQLTACEQENAKLKERIADALAVEDWWHNDMQSHDADAESVATEAIRATLGTSPRDSSMSRAYMVARLREDASLAYVCLHPDWPAVIARLESGEYGGGA